MLILCLHYLRLETGFGVPLFAVKQVPQVGLTKLFKRLRAAFFDRRSQLSLERHIVEVLEVHERLVAVREPVEVPVLLVEVDDFALLDQLIDRRLEVLIEFWQ